MSKGLKSATGLLAMVLVSSVSLAHESNKMRRECNMFPKNSLRIPVTNGVNQTGVTQQEFNQILDLAERAYAPEVKARGAKLVVVKNWTNADVNAFAERSADNKVWTINIFGGLARHPNMTAEGLLLVTCHEIGHQIGEAPHYRGDWAATEGQSDYFASLKCMRKVLGQIDNRKAMRSLVQSSSKAVEDRCARFQQGSKDANNDGMAICLRTIRGGKSLGLTLASVTNVEREKQKMPPIALPSPETPDKNIAKTTTVDGYPELQCRVDTYVAGATCAVGLDTPLDPAKPNSGVCVRPAKTLTKKNLSETSIVDALSARPACWYNQDEMENYKRLKGPSLRRQAKR